MRRTCWLDGGPSEIRGRGIGRQGDWVVRSLRVGSRLSVVSKRIKKHIQKHIQEDIQQHTQQQIRTKIVLISVLKWGMGEISAPPYHRTSQHHTTDRRTATQPPLSPGSHPAMKTADPLSGFFNRVFTAIIRDFPDGKMEARRSIMETDRMNIIGFPDQMHSFVDEGVNASYEKDQD